jgi:hypothetical protein
MTLEGSYPDLMVTTRLGIRGRRMHLGGKEHVGWLPAEAAKPPPTPRTEVDVDFLIEGDEEGAQLYWRGSDGSRWDYSRESVQGAIEQAEFSWGIKPDEWRPE